MQILVFNLWALNQYQDFNHNCTLLIILMQLPDIKTRVAEFFFYIYFFYLI